MMAKRRNVAKKKIIEYWRTHAPFPEDELSFDWSEAASVCWACGRNENTERAHIVPRALQGECVPSNLVLMCESCHKESPDVNDPGYIWRWMKGKKMVFGPVSEDAMCKMARISDLAIKVGVSESEFSSKLKELLSCLGMHKTRISPSSVTWVLEKILSWIEEESGGLSEHVSTMFNGEKTISLVELEILRIDNELERRAALS